MNKKILAIETSAPVCTVALSATGSVYERFEPAQREQSQLLLPMIDSVLTEANLALTDLDAIAVSIGPGSFTGVRLALSAVQGLTVSTDIAVMPISSLQAMAQGIYREHGAEQVLVCVNAYMDEVYSAQFALSDSLMKPLAEEQLIKPEMLELPDDLASWVGVGSGWSVYAERLAGHPKTEFTEYLPKATHVLDLANCLYSPETLKTIDEVSAVYLRNKNAWCRNNT